MLVLVREMRVEDARAFLEVQRAAVRCMAAKDYATNVIDAWAPMQVTEKQVEQVRLNPENEYRLIAEIDGEVVGIGSFIVKNNELRACYVAPKASRKGVGSA